MTWLAFLVMLSSAGTSVHYDTATIIRLSVAANNADWIAAPAYDYFERDQADGSTKTDEEVDLRGVGGSTAAPGGYDAANMAEDVHQLAATLKLERVCINCPSLSSQPKNESHLPVPSADNEPDRTFFPLDVVANCI